MRVELLNPLIFQILSKKSRKNNLHVIVWPEKTHLNKGTLNLPWLNHENDYGG